MSLIEVLAALAIGTLLYLGLAGMISTWLDDARGQQAAHHQALLAEASRKYITAHYSTLLDQSAAGAVAVSVDKLKAEGFLSAGFSDTNSYGQRSCLLVRQPENGKLDSLLVTFGGVAIPDRSIAAIAMGAGPGAGYIAGTAPGEVRGPSWRLTTTDYRAVPCDAGSIVLTGGASDGGHLASNLFYNGPGQRPADFLYRDSVPGRPDLNRMSVALRMSADAAVPAGTPCGGDYGLTFDSATGALMVCDDGEWTQVSFMKKPAANFASLPSGGNTIGDVRMITDLGRAFSWTGSGWQALAVDQEGNLALPNDLVAGGSVVATYGTVRATQVETDAIIATNATVNEALTVSGNAHVGGAATIKGPLTVDRDIHVKMDICADGGVSMLWSEAGNYQIRETMTAGTPCNYYNSTYEWVEFPIGSVVRDAAGLLLSCYIDNTFRHVHTP